MNFVFYDIKRETKTDINTHMHRHREIKFGGQSALNDRGLNVRPTYTSDKTAKIGHFAFNARLYQESRTVNIHSLTTFVHVVVIINDRSACLAKMFFVTVFFCGAEHGLIEFGWAV